ncbi:hypothetical protein C884_02422 [Kocuria palustris PEL]|uniref:HTH cro/C1-type domain-containing protein n=1 Tax=Kocuria palustris PEL TaxID=1236550 RepID=M2YE38_9MICC|nr:helix-turn-helix transcriptional regulator [Kocuria palustris]EME36815.1 hypothetical protein C884_02422 [Kocuria palustris PEL]
MTESLTESWTTAFPSNLRQAREAKGLRQAEVVARMRELDGMGKYNQSALSRTEEGTRVARLDEVICLAHVLECDIADLLRRPDEFAPVVALRKNVDQLTSKFLEASVALENLEGARGALLDTLAKTSEDDGARVREEVEEARKALRTTQVSTLVWAYSSDDTDLDRQAGDER